MRVLVVEDEIRLADNIAAAFREGQGFAVDICHDGEEAILMCKTTEYDLVVLDLMIPKIHGADVLRTVRARDSVSPILILTAISGAQSTIRLLNFGADDYMTEWGRLSRRIRDSDTPFVGAEANVGKGYWWVLRGRQTRAHDRMPLRSCRSPPVPIPAQAILPPLLLYALASIKPDAISAISQDAVHRALTTRLMNKITSVVAD